MNATILAQPSVEVGVPQCLTRLVDTLECVTSFDAAQAATMLAEVDVSNADLSPWYDFDHPVRDSYGRLLVKRGSNFELMVMSWAPGDYSAIHDHGVAEWGAVRYFGAADHIVFTESAGLLSLERRMTMRIDDVFAVDHTLIHLMGNPTETPFVSLHLYGRADSAESITGGARIFELYENKIQRTDGGVFFCLPEGDIERRESCPDADPETRILHHKLMLDRIERVLASERPDPVLAAKQQRLKRELERLSGQQSLRVAS
ncbi:MAG: cysteine dioxygenase family protein [Gammaproteobacteria bacterium]|nr:cysteine dioxygenase family protein [Gammaproteobacteria bacterium]